MTKPQKIEFFMRIFNVTSQVAIAYLEADGWNSSDARDSYRIDNQ